MIRATTGGVMRSYRKNLMSSFIASNKARETVLTQRNFNSYAEAPADAARAFRLRMARLTVNSQYKINEDAYYKFQGAFSCLDSVSKLVDTENGGTQLQTLKSTTLKMLNDPTGDARTQLAKVLDEMSQTIVQTMNQKYGDSFIFAGADGYNVPFEVKTMEDGTNRLYYRGVPVDAAVPKVAMTTDNTTTPPTEAPLKVNANGEYDPTLADGDTYYLKSDEVSVISKDEYEKLYTVPNVDSTNGVPNEYNEDGTPKGVGGAYITVSDDGTLGNYITIEQYNLSSPKPNLVVDDNGDPIEYNTDDFQPTGKGGYYLNTGKTPSEVISIDDYNAAVTRSQNPPTIVQNAAGGNLAVDKNGVPDPTGTSYLIVNGDPKEQVISKADYDTACTDAAKLDYMVNQEKRFIDIGLGFQENENGNLIESSGFNEALNGLTFLGYGLDEDGDPKNIYSIVQRLKEITESVPDGQDWSDDTYNEFFNLVGKLEDAASNFKTEYANMDAGTLKLKNNMDILEDNFYNLDTQTSNLEDVDMVEAISSFIWAEYCYNAALKVGNSILSQSLMDYMS